MTDKTTIIEEPEKKIFTVDDFSGKATARIKDSFIRIVGKNAPYTLYAIHMELLDLMYKLATESAIVEVEEERARYRKNPESYERFGNTKLTPYVKSDDYIKAITDEWNASKDQFKILQKKHHSNRSNSVEAVEGVDTYYQQSVYVSFTIRAADREKFIDPEVMSKANSFINNRSQMSGFHSSVNTDIGIIQTQLKVPQSKKSIYHRVMPFSTEIVVSKKEDWDKLLDLLLQLSIEHSKLNSIIGLVRKKISSLTSLKAIFEEFPDFGEYLKQAIEIRYGHY